MFIPLIEPVYELVKKEETYSLEVIDAVVSDIMELPLLKINEE
jgi:hypothetical protein